MDGSAVTSSPAAPSPGGLESSGGSPMSIGSPPLSPNTVGRVNTTRYPAKLNYKLTRSSPTGQLSTNQSHHRSVTGHSPSQSGVTSPSSSPVQETRGSRLVTSPLFAHGAQDSCSPATDSTHSLSPEQTTRPFTQYSVPVTQQHKCDTNGNDSKDGVSQSSERQCFRSGSIIELSGKRLKRIEDITADDLVNCAKEPQSNDRVKFGSVTHISLSPDGLSMEVTITTESDPEDTSGNCAACEMRSITSAHQPFLLEDSGWASLHPERTLERLGLKCAQLSVGSRVLVASKASDAPAVGVESNNNGLQLSKPTTPPSQPLNTQPRIGMTALQPQPISMACYATPPHNTHTPHAHSQGSAFTPIGQASASQVGGSAMAAGGGGVNVIDGSKSSPMFGQQTPSRLGRKRLLDQPISQL